MKSFLIKLNESYEMCVAAHSNSYELFRKSKVTAKMPQCPPSLLHHAESTTNNTDLQELANRSLKRVQPWTPFDVCIFLKEAAAAPFKKQTFNSTSLFALIPLTHRYPYGRRLSTSAPKNYTLGIHLRLSTNRHASCLLTIKVSMNFYTKPNCNISVKWSSTKA